ncbi:MAG: hypothetical protein IT336_00720 [Thermomicrobiales bacterium]|nr:hypothetical protein [Thermomicrobiales bacterium]
MRRSVVVLMVAVLLLAPTPATAINACGADPLLLYRSYTNDGSPSDPALALYSPAVGSTTRVDVEDSREMVPLAGRCQALIRSGSSDHVLLDGMTGETHRLALDPPGDLSLYAQGGEWAIYAKGVTDLVDSRLVNLESLRVTPLLPDEIDPVLTWLFMSPMGNYLAVDVMAFRDSASYLVPTGDWSRAEAIVAGDWVSLQRFDADDKRILYGGGSGGTNLLAVTEIETGATVVLAETPILDSDAPYLGGWFMPKSDNEYVVRYPDRLAVIVVEDGVVRERFSVDGVYGWVTLSTDGRGALVYGAVSPPVSTGLTVPEWDTPTLWHLDLQNQTIEQLTGPDGEELSVVSAGYRWAIVSYEDEDGIAGLISVDIRSGRMRPIWSPARGESLDPATIRVSEDGRMAIVTAKIEDDRQRLYILDARTGDNRALVESSRVGGSVSPDGVWAAFTTLQRTDSGREMTLTLLEVESGATTLLGPGLDPTWLT